MSPLSRVNASFNSKTYAFGTPRPSLGIIIGKLITNFQLTIHDETNGGLPFRFSVEHLKLHHHVVYENNGVLEIITNRSLVDTCVGYARYVVPWTFCVGSFVCFTK